MMDREFRDRVREILPFRVVVDACVFPRTAKWLIPLTDAARNGYLELYWSPLIIAESNRVLTWLWLKRHRGDFSEHSWENCSTDAKRMFNRLTQVFHVVEDRPPHSQPWESPSDEWDLPIWTAATRCEATFVVTENLADGPPKNAKGIRDHDNVIFIHPNELLRMLDYLADQLEAGDFPELSPVLEEGTPVTKAPFEIPVAFQTLLSALLERKLGGQASE